MTYLATEMLLYLLSAMVISLMLGWLIWGSGRRRKLRALRNDLMAKIEAEREAHHQTRLALDDAESTRIRAVKAAKAEAERSVTELRDVAEAERQAAEDARASVDMLRAEMTDAIEAGQVSGREAVDEAIRAANAEKAAAAEALAKEAQSRAQIEELRLLIGAEKLAAESARSELERVRAEMEEQLKAERIAHEQAKVALDDIRSTLARTLGPEALDAVGAASQLFAGDAAEPGKGAASPFGAMTDMASAGDALNNLDLDEADSEDREDLSLDLSPTIDAEPASDADVEPDDNEAIEIVDSEPPPPDRVALRPLPLEAAESERPATLLDQRPDDVDDFQAIDGISPEIERRLHDAGCYRYRQLTELSPRDIEWLAEAIDVNTFQIAADRWVEQAESLIREDGSDDGPIFLEPTDRENAAG